MQNIVATIFNVESEGFQAITTLSKKAINRDYAIMEMALVKKNGNSLTVCDSFSSGIKTTDDTVTGGLIGSLVGILGGPIGVLLGGSTGAFAGAILDSKDGADSASMIEMVASKILDGETALIILADEADESGLDAELRAYKSVTLRYDAAIIYAEVEEAYKIQKEMERQAREKLRAEKKDDHKRIIEEKRAKLAADFEGLKAKFSRKE
ncbi:MAG: DUF1269 domain-containing protein [Lachnospiraceae bacterium]|nr:DUF1269 domain-containing protein [Lachnospiraceae bacterium]